MGLRDYQRHSAKVTRTRRWKALRWVILRRDGFRCVTCGERGDLEVDHVKAVRDAPELAYEPGNLQSLCKPCHSAKTRMELGWSKPSADRQRWQKLVNELGNKGRTNR